MGRLVALPRALQRSLVELVSCGQCSQAITASQRALGAALFPHLCQQATHHAACSTSTQSGSVLGNRWNGHQSAYALASSQLRGTVQHWAFHCSAFSLAHVVVPSMGDSITEGTIASVLKAPGDSVKEDEPIALLETDKVTMEVKSPVTGTIASLSVKEGDTVRVGQQVANVREGEGAKASTSEQPAPAEASPTPSPAEPEPSSDSHGSGYRPRIKFPPRRDAEGNPIKHEEHAEQAEAEPAEQAVAEQAEADDVARPPTKLASQSNVKITRFQYPGGSPRVNVGTKLSFQRVLTAREMEIIELGGADP